MRMVSLARHFCLGTLCVGATAFASAASAQPAGVPVGMAVTVTKAQRTCFSDTLQVSGILMPHEEVLVRPDGSAEIAAEDRHLLNGLGVHAVRNVRLFGF